MMAKEYVNQRGWHPSHGYLNVTVEAYFHIWEVVTVSNTKYLRAYINVGSFNLNLLLN